MTRATYRELVHSMVRDDVAALTLDDCEDAMGHAVTRYARFRPRVLVADLSAAATGIVSNDVATDLAQWDADLSGVVSVEHPVDEIPPLHVEHSIYRAPGALRLYAEDVPAADTVRITYTVPHVVGADTCTVPEADSEAVASWAAARLLEEIAARGAGVTDSTINADGIDHNRQTSDYRALAKGYRDRFYELLGIDRKDEMKTPGASATAQLASRRLMTGTRRLTHFRPGGRYGI